MQTRPLVRLLVITVIAFLAWGAGAGAANAADPGPVILKLDDKYVLKKVTDLPAELLTCAHVPGGAKPGVDGWSFDQPMVGAHDILYVIGYIIDEPSGPTPILLGIGPGGVVTVPISTAAATVPGMVPGAIATPAPSTTPSPAPTIGPPPPGVTGGLIDGGAGGAWLQTPKGWILGGGAMQGVVASTDAKTFGLTSACLPAASGTPSPSPTATGSPTPPAVLPALQETTGTLPRTGAPVGLIVGTGVVLVGVGAALRLAYARRRRVPSVAVGPDDQPDAM